MYGDGGPPKVPCVVRTRGDGPRETAQPYPDLGWGRDAWLVAQRSPGVTWATLEKTSGPPEDRTVCEWSKAGGFVDRTREHRLEIDALTRQLSASAPAGYSASLERGRGRGEDWRVVFRGAPTPASMEVVFSDAARVRAHWATYVASANAPGTLAAADVDKVLGAVGASDHACEACAEQRAAPPPRRGFKVVVATRSGEPMVFTGFASRAEAERHLAELRKKKDPAIKRNAVWEILTAAAPHEFVVKARINDAWWLWDGRYELWRIDAGHASRLARSAADQTADKLRAYYRARKRDVRVEPAPPPGEAPPAVTVSYTKRLGLVMG